MLTAKRLRHLVNYAPETGRFSWRGVEKKPGCRRVAGQEIGHLNKALGYWIVYLDGKPYYAHRLAWLYMTGKWPKVQIDHKDTDRSNNRWTNLRLATSGQNKMNRPSIGNMTGVKGVYKTANNTFMAQVWAGGRNVFSKRFPTIEEAAVAREAAANRHHGEFARHE